MDKIIKICNGETKLLTITQLVRVDTKAFLLKMSRPFETNEGKNDYASSQNPYFRIDDTKKHGGNFKVDHGITYLSYPWPVPLKQISSKK